jgi:hypothetical protein
MGEAVMSRFHLIRAVLASCAVMSFLPAASQLDEPTYDDNVYVSCPYRVAAIFPRQPMTRDLTYATGGKSAPARQFYIQDGANMFSVIVANFSNGPAVDEKLLDSAAAPLRQRGEIRFQFAAEYDPGIPGRQLNIMQPDGKQLRASVYMADHRLYITESTSAPGDFAALQFEQSVSLIDANGTDLDKNPGMNSRQYNCRK